MFLKVVEILQLKHMNNIGFSNRFSSKFSELIYKVFRFFMFLGVGFIVLYPILYMISAALRPASQIYDKSIIWIPKSLTLENIKFAAENMNYWKTLTKTVGVVLISTVLQCITCSLTAYGFAKFNFKGKKILFACVLFTLIIPPQAINLPMYISYVHFDFFGLGQIGRLFGEPFTVSVVDTIFPNVISTLFAQGLRAGLFIYMYHQYYRNLPVELSDAACIDGAGFMKTYLRIMWPNAGPITLVTFLLSFVWYWNDYIYTALMLKNFQPISVVLANFQSYLQAFRIDGDALNSAQMSVYSQAACLLYILPPLLLYTVLQNKFTKSIAKVGIVG